MKANPVFNRLTRGNWWLSDRTTQRIAFAASAVFGLLGLLPLLLELAGLSQIAALPMLIIAVLSGALWLLGPPAAVMITALGTAERAAQEDMSLLRLTGISPSEIVSGYVRAAEHRLRVMWVLGLGLVVGVMTMILSSLTIYGLTNCRFFNVTGTNVCTFGDVISSLLVGLLVLAIGLVPLVSVVILLMAFFWLGMLGGVWAGLRWPRQAATVGGLIAVLHVVLVGAALAMLTAGAVVGLILCGVISLAPLSVGMWLSPFLLNQSERAIESWEIAA